VRQRRQKLVLDPICCFGFGARTFGAKKQLATRLFGTLQLADVA
jgi:hypothetical protein